MLLDLSFNSDLKETTSTLTHCYAMKCQHGIIHTHWLRTNAIKWLTLVQSTPLVTMQSISRHLDKMTKAWLYAFVEKWNYLIDINFLKSSQSQICHSTICSTSCTGKFTQEQVWEAFFFFSQYRFGKFISKPSVPNTLNWKLDTFIMIIFNKPLCYWHLIVEKVSASCTIKKKKKKSLHNRQLRLSFRSQIFAKHNNEW